MKAERNYDKIAHLYNSKARTEHPFRKKAYQEWIKECNKHPWNKALDLGCGAGHSTRFLAKFKLLDIFKQPKLIWGIDISRKEIKEARKEPPVYHRTYFIIDDIFRDWGVTPPSWQRFPFHLVASFASLHYARRLEELENFFSNISKCIFESEVLPGGRIVSVIMDPDNPAREYKRGASSYSRWIDTPFQDGSRLEVILLDQEGREICGLENVYWSKKTYEKLMRKFGFSEIQWKTPKYIKKMGLNLFTAKKET